MKVLIINSGSSSIKYQLMLMPAEQIVCQGIVERIGSQEAIFTYKTDKDEVNNTLPVMTHNAGLKLITELLVDPKIGVIKNASEIDAVGHRVVHGGSTLYKATLVDEQVIDKINKLSALAPLHNPHNLEGIVLAEKFFGNAKQIAVFDTAFHHTIPEKARKYAMPNEFFDEHGIQVYGFHGISHKYVTAKAIDYLNKQESKIVSIHLGNGCSMTAVHNGKSVDHSLGFTPSNGLIMGTRSGDIDHAVIFYLVDTLGYNLDEVKTLLTRKSGMLGLTGFTDLRDIQEEAEKGNKNCLLALEMNAYRIKKYIGAYAASMNGLDAVLFTAGIGENSSLLREMVCRNMEFLGLQLDSGLNVLRNSDIREISTTTSKVKILVVPTNEELEIAKEAYNILTISTEVE
ncbi:acetate/propionate family kinase [Arenibacter certesii]|uniref:Acetate kinase n=1 Tax=Arenibacter certesii TaxID=228955 RepID=A0A918MHD2_9FLAO|nr:acetate kinase [Arenibacter certesii]GGW24515.1 acetate kinase [Arenibacter certesii]